MKELESLAEEVFLHLEENKIDFYSVGIGRGKVIVLSSLPRPDTLPSEFDGVEWKKVKKVESL